MIIIEKHTASPNMKPWLPDKVVWGACMSDDGVNGRRVWSLALLAVCEVAVLGLWFSASAVVPTLIQTYNLSPSQASMMTSAVQIGFVAGTLTSAILSLADRLDPRRFFMFSALVAAGANALLLAVEPTSPVVIVLRFITGACMAGVYPVGMKMAVSWARDDVGLLIGILVGALTLGSAAPHLFNAFGGIDWRFTILAASAVALSAALLINLVRPENGTRAAVLTRSRLSGFSPTGAAIGELRLSGAHVGALRHVGLAGGLSGRFIPPWHGGGGGGLVVASGDFRRHGPGRRHRLSAGRGDR